MLDSTETGKGILVPTKVRQGPREIAKVSHLQNIEGLYSACLSTLATPEVWDSKSKLTGASGVSRANRAGITPQSIKASL